MFLKNALSVQPFLDHYHIHITSVNIEGKLLQTLSIVLVPFVSLCKPAFTICLCQFYFLVQGECTLKKVDSGIDVTAI